MGNYYIGQRNLEDCSRVNTRLRARTSSQKTKGMSGQALQDAMVEIIKLVGKGVIECTEYEYLSFII